MATIRTIATTPVTHTAHKAGHSRARVAIARPSFVRALAANTFTQTHRTPKRLAVRASAAADAKVYPPNTIFEVTKNTWSSILDSTPKDTLVVLDCFTDWCGPCKMIYPQLCELATTTHEDVRWYKLNCNKENKDLGKSLGVKVAPTFFLFKNGVQVAMMTGAKVDELDALINSNK